MSAPTPASYPFPHVDAAALFAMRDRHGSVFRKGRVLYRAGETSSDLYVVLRGRVALFSFDEKTGTSNHVREVGPGGYFGEYACFGREPRRYTAVVHENETAILVFTQVTATELLVASPRFIIEIINELAERLLELEAERNKLRRDTGQSVVKSLIGS